VDSARPFKYIGGDASLDLVNTVDWTDQGLRNERLTSYERLLEWAQGAELVNMKTAGKLRDVARSRPKRAAAAYEEALGLRSVAAGERPAQLWNEFNQRLTDAMGRLRVAPMRAGDVATGVAGWQWLDSERRLDAVLWPVLRAAAELLTSEDSTRIQVCDGPDCGWMFVDRSRNHLRRWCEMETCGTAAKTRRRRERTRRATRRAAGTAKHSS
jgi:predicted RNA-binding Zn ribbon-like protein